MEEEKWNYSHWANVRRLRNKQVSLLSFKATTYKEIHSAQHWKKHSSENAAVLHSVIVLNARGCKTQVKGTERPDHSELNILNLDEVEDTNSDTGRTAVPHKELPL